MATATDTDIVTDAATRSDPRGNRDRGFTLAAIVIALYWCQLFYQLQIEWTANDQYGYGWFVPFLAAGLLWRRWLDRSAPSAKCRVPSAECRTRWVVVLLMFLLLPLRMIHEANVGWRTAQWLHAFILLAITLYAIRQLGGWNWVKHFWFPVAFLLVSVPWPSRIEEPIVQGLMRLAAGTTVEVVGFFDVPAFQRGNLIEVSTGVVSVDGACSGVRSLQTSFMAALLMGELFRLFWKRRLLLVPLGFAIAFLANVARTSLLTWSAARQGFARMETLHGPAGVGVVVVVLGGIYLSSLVMARKQNAAEKAESRQQETDAGPITTGVGTGLAEQTPQCSTRPQLSPRWLIAALVWLGVIELVTAAWFRSGDRRAVDNPAWSVNWPTNATSYKEAPASKAVIDMMRYDTMKNTSWQDQAGNVWSFMQLYWTQENKNSFIGRGHTPDICFKGAGWQLCGEPEPIRISINGLDLQFRRYLFEVDGKTAYVFLTFWDERSPGGRQDLPVAYSVRKRLLAAVQARRNQGLKKLEISLIGPRNADDALDVLKKGLQELIVVQNPAEKISLK